MAATNFTPIQLYHSTSASAVPLAANLAQGELAININDGKLYYEDSTGVVQVIATKGAGTIGGSTTQIQYNNAGALAGNAAMVFNSATSTTTLTTLNLTNALGAIYGGTAQSTYTQGDILYSSASNTLAKLGIGVVNYILTSTGSIPQWVAPSSIAVLTATNLDGGAAGSVPYQSGVATTTFLAIGAANRVMTSTGTAPQWVTALTGLTGVSSSSITNTSLTSGRVTFASTSGLLADSANLTFNGTTLTTTGLSNSGFSTLVKTLTLGDTSFNGTAVFAPTTPAKLYMGTGTVTDVTSAISATNTTGAISSLAITPIAATNTGVTYTNASTLYIAGAPSAGTNITITNPFALYIAGGTSYLGGAVTLGGTVSGGGNQINNVVIGNSSPLAGAFTTVTAGKMVITGGASTTLLSAVITDNDTDLKIGGSGSGTNKNIKIYSDGFGTLVGTFSSTGLAVTGTLSATGNVTLGDASADTLNVGNGDLIKDASGNLGLGVTPSTVSPGKAIEVGFAGNILQGYNSGTFYIGQNWYFNSADKFAGNGRASVYVQNAGAHSWQTSSISNVSGAGAGASMGTVMLLDSSGNLGIGTSSPGAKLDISYAGGTSSNTTLGLKIGADVGNNTSRTVNTRKFASIGGANYSNSSSNIGIVYCDSDLTTSIISIGGGSSGVYDATEIRFITAATTTSTTGSQRMILNSAGDVTVSTGNLIVGTAGKGIDFSADPSAAGMTSELLDDYEEGGWTPAAAFSGGNGTLVYGYQLGYYTKIGQQVTLNGLLQFDKGSASGNFLISGLPFTRNNNLAGSNAISVMAFRCGLAGSTVAGVVTQNATTIDMYLQAQNNSTAFVAVTATHFDGNTASFYMTITYTV